MSRLTKKTIRLQQQNTGAEFRRDIESFVSQEVVDACRIPGRRELPFVASVRYMGFVDPSGGSQDSYCLGIAHEQDGKAVLDCIRERRPPFSPEQVTKEYADLLKSYKVFRVAGDRYAGEWPREQFRKNGIEYQPSDLSKSDIYRELLAPLNSERIELLDNSRLIAQLCGLERRTSRSGKDSIDHGANLHDDLINAAAGALVSAFNQGSQVFQELNEAVHNLDRYVNPAEEYRWMEFCGPLKKISALCHAPPHTAFLQMAIDYDGIMYALEEYYQSDRLITENTQAIRNISARYGKQSPSLLCFGMDTNLTNVEAFSILNAYDREKVETMKALKTAVEVGIDLIKEYLRIDSNKTNSFNNEKGAPKLFISKQRCPNLWREMIGLKSMEDNGVVKYVGTDYTVTALRTIMMSRPQAPVREPRNLSEPCRFTSPWM